MCFEPRAGSGQLLTAFPANLADSLFSGQHVAMPVDVVPYSADWPAAFDRVAVVLRAALVDVPCRGRGRWSGLGRTSTAVTWASPGVRRSVRRTTTLVVTCTSAGPAPSACATTWRSATSSGPGTDLRDEYAAVKLALAADHAMDTTTYLARKSDVLQKVLAESDLTDAELRVIRRLNDPSGLAGTPPGTA